MTKVKICGITNPDDARHAVECGADMLGFNFYRESPRYITEHAALEIAATIPASVNKVGVFVNMGTSRVSEIASMIGLDMVQIHGDENRAFVGELRSETSAKIIKAFRLSPDGNSVRVEDSGADFILLDNFSADKYGGTGRVFDWSIADRFQCSKAKLILAGGLTPKNVAEAVRTVGPYAVDVASGVESSPGKKDPDKVAEFIRAAKESQ
jgi:phosphoribosylanthranilate isomerase